MTHEEIKKYKEYVLSLSREDSLKRDEYLRDYAQGKYQGPLLGYPSLDKPALAYYNFEEYCKEKPKQTIMEALLKNNKDHLEDTAIKYFGSKISYGDLIENIVRLVKSLRSVGTQKGDTFAVCLPGIPEAMYAVYAAGYIGATSIFLPPYLRKEVMISDLNKGNCKTLLVLDLFYEKNKEVFDDVIAKTSVERLVIVPTLNSSILKYVKAPKEYKGTMQYDDFLDKGKMTSCGDMCQYEKQMPVAVVYSSGTTGDLKGVLLSHDSINNSALSYLPFGFDLKRGQQFYQAIPVWSSTGLVANGTSPLYYGSILHQNPKFDPIAFSKNIGLSRDNWGIGTTELFNGLDALSKKRRFRGLLKMHILDYSKLTNAYIGGTLSTPNDKAKLNEIFKLIGSPAVANSSYGTCENGSIVTAELNDLDHYDYSVGIPIPGACVIAVDKDGHELPYMERGELAVYTDCGMIDYYNRPDLKNVFFADETGKVMYKHTGDIGYVMPNGFVIYEGRANDKSVVDGTEIYNFDVKKVLLSDPDVFDCEVFMHDDKLCAHIVFRHAIDDLNAKLRELQEKIMVAYNDDVYVPELFKVRSSFPMASSTKRDYKAIKAETDGYISILKNRYARAKKCDIL